MRSTNLPRVNSKTCSS